MAKINRYRLEYGYGSLKQEMTRTLEPVSDSDYIEVSELRELISKEKTILIKQRNEMRIEEAIEMSIYFEVIGQIKALDTLLAAIDTEEK